MRYLGARPKLVQKSARQLGGFGFPLCAAIFCVSPLVCQPVGQEPLPVAVDQPEDDVLSVTHLPPLINGS
jgi:hypothetical protein